MLLGVATNYGDFCQNCRTSILIISLGVQRFLGKINTITCYDQILVRKMNRKIELKQYEASNLIDINYLFISVPFAIYNFIPLEKRTPKYPPLPLNHKLPTQNCHLLCLFPQSSATILHQPPLSFFSSFQWAITCPVVPEIQDNPDKLLNNHSKVSCLRHNLTAPSNLRTAKQPQLNSHKYFTNSFLIKSSSF